jgi:glycosyltransferase involved in cell wall biosynthesis
MKIAYLFGSLNRGGTETLLLDVFRNASKNNLESLGIYRKTGVYENEFLTSGVPMYKLSVGRNPISYLFRLRKLLHKNNVTIVHAQQPIDALYARIACIGTGIKVVLTLHGYDYTENKEGLFVLKTIIGRTDRNIYVSDTQRTYYEDKYKLSQVKQTVVYNGISFDKLDKHHTQSTALSRAPSYEENLRAELQLSPDILLIGSIGNFNLVRDQFTICNFLKLLHGQGIDFHFVFAGKRIDSMPDLYDRCVNFCRDNELEKNVLFLGVRNDVPEILRQLDAFVYSTDHDTFGIAVVEAMAVGIPIFVNDWGVMTEITDGGKYASLYKTKDEQDLLREFMLFLQNKEVYRNKANQAATFVREKYSIEKHIEKLKEVYSDIVNSL